MREFMKKNYVAPSMQIIDYSEILESFCAASGGGGGSLPGGGGSGEDFAKEADFSDWEDDSK